MFFTDIDNKNTKKTANQGYFSLTNERNFVGIIF